MRLQQASAREHTPNLKRAAFKGMQWTETLHHIQADVHAFAALVGRCFCFFNNGRAFVLFTPLLHRLAKLKTQSTIEEADILPSTSATAQLIESAVAPCSAEAVDGADGSAEELRIVQCVNTVGNAAVVAVGALRAIEVGSEPTIRRYAPTSFARCVLCAHTMRLGTLLRCIDA